MIRHEVLTTEKVPFRYRVAGPGARFLAWLIDAAILAGLFLAGVLMGTALEAGREGLGMALMALWVFGLQWGYFLLFEWLWQGQTLGKFLIGLRVIDSGGRSIGFLQSAIRNVLRVVDALPVPMPLWCGLAGFAVAACNRESRRLGDLAAGTLVVYLERRWRPVRALQEAAEALDRSRLSLLRQRLTSLSREQKESILDLSLRRDQLRWNERARLFQAVANFTQARLELEPEEYESPEKFVLRLGAVLGDWAAEMREPASG
jgi:uncharacterized RDD family membrane protein YckC